MPESKIKGKGTSRSISNGAKGTSRSNVGTKAGSRGLRRSLETSVAKSCDLRESYHTIATNVLNLTDTDDLEEVFVAAARVSCWA